MDDASSSSAIDSRSAPDSSSWTLNSSVSSSAFPHDWYIRVKVPFTTISTSNLSSQIPAFEKKVASLYHTLQSSLSVPDIHLLPQRFMDPSEKRTKSSRTCHWLISLPALSSAEIKEAWKIIRAWERAENVKAVFVKNDASLQRALKQDTDLEDEPAISSIGKSKSEERRTGESFKKIKGSNPAQVRKQFLLHAMGGEASTASGVHSQNEKGSAGKLRPPKDVFDRLKYDGGYRVEDYAVGYIDRQAGILEKSVKEWREFEEVELIAYFRYVPGDEIVWDRARRVDWVFNKRPG